MSEQDRKHFYKELSELLNKYNAAIIVDDISKTDRSFHAVGFQFGIHNTMTTRSHITGYDLINEKKEC